jgi:hypothetical protein
MVAGEDRFAGPDALTSAQHLPGIRPVSGNAAQQRCQPCAVVTLHPIGRERAAAFPACSLGKDGDAHARKPTPTH